MKIKKAALCAALIGSLAFGENALAQDKPVTINGNVALEYLADSIGNQDGLVQSMESDYMKGKFEKSDRLYVRTATPELFYSNGMREIYTSLDDAVKYCIDNPVKGPQTVLEFDKTGKVTKAYLVGPGVEEVKEFSTADYNSVMRERKAKSLQERLNR